MRDLLQAKRELPEAIERLARRRVPQRITDELSAEA